MTSWIVNYVIDKYLNHIIEVDSSVTDASIFKDGQIEFGKVKIKQDFLKTLNMPFFEFKETFIGKFTAKIYYSLLRLDCHFENYPIYIALDEVFILVRQKGMSDWSEEEKIKEMENYKKFKLQEFEDAYKQYLMNMVEKTENDFIKKIIHNLNLSITNVVVRFEDEISNPSNPYSLGLIISKVICKPTKENFDVNNTEEIPFSDINNKVLELKGFSVFMDIQEKCEPGASSFKNYLDEEKLKIHSAKKSHLKDSFEYYCYCNEELNTLTQIKNSHNYLIFNLDMNLKLSMNSAVKKNFQPAIFSDLLINSINLKINLFQIKTIIKLLNVVKSYSIAQSGMENYYFTKKLSDQDKEKYTELYVKYFEERYLKNLKESEWSFYVKQIGEYETQIQFNEIQAIRNAANIKLEYMKKINDYNDKIGKLKPGYFTFFTSQATMDEMKKMEDDRDKLLNSEDVIKKLMDEEMQKKNIPEKDPYEGMDRSYVKMDLKFALKSFTFELMEENSKELLDIIFQDFESHILQGVNSMQSYLFLGDFSINQYKLKDTVFNKIIESVDDNDENSEALGNNKQGNIYEKYYEEKKGALSVGFEMSPDLGPSNYRIRIRNKKRLYIYANLYSLKFIGFLIGEAVKSEIDLTEVSKYATEEGYKHIQNGYKRVNTILAGEYQHFNMEADVLILGPRVVVPQNILENNNKKCLMLSFGEFGLLSNLAPIKDLRFDYKKITEDKKIYDVYEMKIYGFEFLTIEKFMGAAEISRVKKLNIVDKVDFDLIFAQIIEPKNEIRENFSIAIQYKSIDLKIRDTQIEFLLYFLKYFGEMNQKLEKEIKILSGNEEKKEENSQERNVEQLNKDALIHRNSFLDSSNTEDEIKYKEKKQEILKEEKKIDSIFQKFFMKFEFSLLRVNVSIFKSLEKEERELLQKNSCLSDETEYKEYLTYILNNFTLNVNMREDLYLEMNMRIFNFFLIDKDYVWKVNNNGNIFEHSILNQEFSIILGTLNSEIEREVNTSRSMSMKSEALEKTTEVLKKLGKIPFFLDVSLKQDTPNKKTDINVTLTKFVLTFNFSTYTRLMKFIGKIQKYSNEILSVEKPVEKETIKEKLKKIESKKDEYIKKGIKKEFMPKLLGRIKDRKGKNNLNNENVVDINEKNFDRLSRKSQGRKSIRSKRMSIMENMNEYSKEFVKQKLKFSFEMKQIELNIPLDAESNKTKAIVFNFNTMIKLKQVSETDNYYDKSKNLVLQNYHKKNMFVNIMLFNIDFDMYNVANDQILFNLLNDKILSNSRITVFVKSFLLEEKKSEIMTVDVKIEPITMLIGFRQTRIIKDFMEIMQNSLYPKPEEQEYFFEDKDNIGLNNDILVKNSEQKIEFNQNGQKINKSLDAIAEEEKKSKLASKIGEELSKKISKIDKKIENQVKYNITTFNKLMDVNFILEKASIKLIDNTGNYERPLTMIELSKITLKMINNTKPYDIDNMCQAIVEMVSERKAENLNICNMYMYLDSYFSIEMCSFNERVSDWEPILEPWNGNFKIEQIDKITRKKIQFKSDFMMNFNLSVQSVDVLNAILKKMNQNEQNWKKEELKKAHKMLESDKSYEKKKKSDSAILFENRSGLDIEFYFLADDKKKFNLMNNYQKSFTKNELNIIYQSLSEEIAIKKKDKFAFKFGNIEYIIDEVDFSFNHFIIKKIPINGGNKENLKSFEMENSKEQKNSKGNAKEKDKVKAKTREKDMKNKKNLKEHKGYVNITNEEIEEENQDCIEICIKIKNNGLIKVISIESNIGIFNNTCYTTKLCFFNMKKNDINSIFSNGSLEISKSASIIKCESNGEVKLPLNLVIEPHILFLSLSLESNEQECYNLILNDLNYVYNIGKEYNEQITKNSEEDEKKIILKKLTKEKCLQVKFENEKKILIFSLDFLMLRTKNHLVTTLDEEKNKKHELFFYQLILNPPIIFENKIPFDLNVNYKYSFEEPKSDSEIRPEIFHNDEKYNNNIFILPLDKYKIYNFDAYENFVDLLLSVNYQNEHKYQSREISSRNLEKEKNFVEINYENYTSDYFEMIIEQTKITPTKFYDYNYLSVENFFSKSKVFICYFEFILINRLEEDIFIKPNGVKIEDLDLQRLACYNLCAKSINLFSTPHGNSKAKVKIDKSDWSDQFELGAHGLQAGHSVQHTDPVNDSNQINYEFATIITSSNNFNFSTVIIIEPRYVIVNKTGIDLKFRQVFNKDYTSKETQFILNDSEKVVKLFKYPKEKSFKNIQFFLSSGFFDNEDQNPDLWSQTINIENLQEYNIALFIPRYYDFKKYSKINELEKNKNIFEYDEQNKFFLIRVILQTLDNGLIYIILTEPKHPQFLVKNTTKEFVKISQFGVQHHHTISPGKIIPYTLRDFSIADSGKKIELEILGKKSVIDLDTIEEISEICLDREKDLKNSNSMYGSNPNGILNVEIEEKLNMVENPKIFLSVSTDHKNITRIININTNFDDEEGLLDAKQNIICKRVKSSSINFKFKLKGIGLSFIDSQPKEIFYISFYNLKVILRNYITKNNFVISKYANYVIYLKNFQVDYCLEGSFKQIIYPKIQYIPFRENQLKKSDHVDFVKILFTKANSTNSQNDSEMEKIAQFEFLIQEFNVKIDQQVINVLLELISQFVNRLDFYKEGKLEEDDDKRNNEIEEDDDGTVYNEEENSENLTNRIKNNLINEEEIAFIKRNITKTKSNLLKSNSYKRLSMPNSSGRGISILDKNSFEATISPNYPNFEEVLKKADEYGIYNIGNLTLSGIKINLTLRIDISSLEISLVPAFVTRLLGTVGNALARITDSPLSFNELRINNVYNSMAYIIGFITGKYKSQGIMQIYKIIGSSDLIGNPVGLVGKIGTGFKEFFNEPRKGFVNGPIHFGTGVAKGVNALVSNVVGGGLDAVGKITGTLYNATKNIQGEKAGMTEEEEPSNLITGAYDGIKGGVGELAKGIAGIFVNPYKSAKKEGVKGFIKGFGKGLLGAVVSPFSAVLKVGNSLAIGMKNTATYFTRSKLKTDRFRHPRHINQSEGLKPFDNDLAETQAIIANLYKKSNGGKATTFPKIIFTKDFTFAEKEYSENVSTIIITDYYLLVVFNAETKLMDVILKTINKTEVHKGKDKEFLIVLFLKDGRKKFIPCLDLSLLCQIHGVLQKLI